MQTYKQAQRFRLMEVKKIYRKFEKFKTAKLGKQRNRTLQLFTEMTVHITIKRF